MKQEALKYFSEIHLTVFGLVLFFTFFTVMVLWVNRKSGKQLYQRLARIPLDGGGEIHEQR